MSQPATSAPARTRLDHDERRAQILSCARRLFGELDYDAVSSAEIARAAGVSRALLNHYFGSKRELLLEVVRGMLEVPPVPVPEYVEGASVEERVAQSVEGWLELLSKNRQTWLAAVRIAGWGRDDELEKIVDESRDRAVDRIIAVTGLREIVREYPEIRSVLRGFSGMAESTTREWLRYGRLNRAQVRVLLEGALLKIIRELLPEVLAAGDVPSSHNS